MRTPRVSIPREVLVDPLSKVGGKCRLIQRAWTWRDDEHASHRLVDVTTENTGEKVDECLARRLAQVPALAEVQDAHPPAFDDEEVARVGISVEHAVLEDPLEVQVCQLVHDEVSLTTKAFNDVREARPIDHGLRQHRLRGQLGVGGGEYVSWIVSEVA